MKTINRRVLLRNGIKAGAGLLALPALNSAPVRIFARLAQDSDRFKPALQRLDEYIGRHLQEMGAPGLTLALANRNGLIRESHHGFADLKAGSRVTPQTLFQIGSISKSFVGIAVLQLADEGKLDLHKPVSAYLPWLRTESEFPPFTTHHLLNHTAGLSGVPLLMRVAATKLRAGAAPGARFLYSNIGYVLLGFIIEAADQKPFAVSLQQRLLDPLGMTASAPIISNAIRERLAIGYAPMLDDRPFPFRGKLGEAPWLEVAEAAGSVAATARDMGQYMTMLLNRGVGSRSRVLSEKGFDLFTHKSVKAPFRGEEAHYGYGLWISEHDGHVLLRHTGGMVAFSSAMYADMTDGIAVFASVNARMGGYRPISVARYALDLFNASLRGKALPDAPAPLPAPDRVVNAADYAGTFSSPDGAKIVLTGESQRLVLESNGRRIVLEQAGRDRFVVKDPQFELFALSFGRTDNRVVEAFHGSKWWVNDRYTGPKIFEHPKEWKAFGGHYRSDSPWYGSLRVVIRKGRLWLNGEQPLLQVGPAEFRPDGGDPADRIVFDTMLNGHALRMNFSGIEYHRMFTE